jgi:hypothetical protein
MLVHFFYVMSGFDEKNFEFKNSFGKEFGEFVCKIKRKSFSLWRLTGGAHPSGPPPSSNRRSRILSLSSNRPGRSPAPTFSSFPRVSASSGGSPRARVFLSPFFSLLASAPIRESAEKTAAGESSSAV